MLTRAKLLIAFLVLTVALTSCTNSTGPVRAAESHKNAYKQAYIYGFPMIAAYKAMYQFNVDKTNSQYKRTIQHGCKRGARFHT